jgi:hypothetical protein
MPRNIAIGGAAMLLIASTALASAQPGIAPQPNPHRAYYNYVVNPRENPDIAARKLFPGAGEADRRDPYAGTVWENVAPY